MSISIFFSRLAACAAIIVFACGLDVPDAYAQADLEGGYAVPEGRTTVEAEHDNAVYYVFQSSPPPHKKLGIFFVQTQGEYTNSPFICNEATWIQSEQSYSCSKALIFEDSEFLETVTIGKLPNAFCDRMRDEHNEQGDPNPPILKQNECTGAGRCSCYEIKHECRDRDPHAQWENCTDDLMPESRSTRRTTDKGRAPPSRGAGSGKSNN